MPKHTTTINWPRLDKDCPVCGLAMSERINRLPTGEIFRSGWVYKCGQWVKAQKSEQNCIYSAEKRNISRKKNKK